MKRILSILIVLCAGFELTFCIDCSINPKTNEGLLKKTLLCDYDKTLRPVLDPNKQILIDLKMFMKSYEFDSRSQKITLHSWFALKWMDEHLQWEKTRYDGLSKILVESDKIWIPDVSLYNSAEGQNLESCSKVNCEVEFNGTVRCVFPCSHTAFCSGNFERWPFDIQNCSLFYGSWMSPGEHIDFRTDKIGVKTNVVQNNSIFKLVKASVIRKSYNYSCCPNQTFPSLEYSIVLERHAAAIAAFILAPAVVLVIINLLSLWLDATTNERVLLSALDLIGHFLYLQHLGWLIPNNGDTVPRVLKFFNDSIFITIFLLINTCISRCLSNCTAQTPKWMEKVVDYVSGNICGNYFLSKNINEFIPGENGDVQGLVDEQKDQPKSGTIWKIFAKCLDRSIFLTLFLAYFIMLVTLIPENYLYG